jgi:hypothetical protein
MVYQLLETVVLARDLPEYNLVRGDLGAVVEVYESGVEVEFVTAAGETKAVVTLREHDVRNLEPSDMPAVRSLR